MATTFGTPTICPPVDSASEMPRSNTHANGNAWETHYPSEIVGVLSNQARTRTSLYPALWPIEAVLENRDYCT